MSELITEEFWNECVNHVEDMDGWTLEWNNNKIECYSKRLFDHTDLSAIKCYTTFDYPADLLFKTFLDMENRTEWAENTLKSQCVEKGSEIFVKFSSDDWDIVYMLNQPPFSMISAREMLLARKYKKVENGYDVVCKSIDHHDDFPVVYDIVRAEVLLQKVRIRVNEKDSNRSDVVFLHQINCLPNV